MSQHTYTLTFRGDHVQTFTSVYEVQAVRLGYRRYILAGQNQWEPPLGNVARKPEVLRKMKTVAALKRDSVPSRFATFEGQTFVVVVKPGVTEITEAEVAEGVR